MCNQCFCGTSTIFIDIDLVSLGARNAFMHAQMHKHIYMCVYVCVYIQLYIPHCKKFNYFMFTLILFVSVCLTLSETCWVLACN